MVITKTIVFKDRLNDFINAAIDYKTVTKNNFVLTYKFYNTNDFILTFIIF